MDITKYLRETIQEEYGSYRRFARIIGMPNSTLTTNLNKENGFGKMPVDSAIKICKELGLDINEIYNYEVEPLTIDEKELIDIYKTLSQSGKDFVRQSAESISEFESNQTTLVMPMINSGIVSTTQLDYYDTAAGLGPGQIVENAVPKKMNIPTRQVPENADFIIRVVGDSMEPKFSDNDKLFIESTNVLKVGDIGVFTFNGETMVKEFGEGELISYNKAYSPIKVNEGLYIQGKVLGKV